MVSVPSFLFRDCIDTPKYVQSFEGGVGGPVPEVALWWRPQGCERRAIKAALSARMAET